MMRWVHVLVLAVFFQVGGLAAARQAWAFGPRTSFRLAILNLDPSVADRVAALKTLAQEVRKRTSIEAALEPVLLSLDPNRIYEFPFLILPVCRELAPLSREQAETLRRYLDLGGFLLLDNCQGRLGGGADAWIRREVAHIYPSRMLKPLPADHSLFRSFYLLDRAFGRSLESPDLLGVDEADRTAIVVHPNDLLGALLRDPYGNPLFDLPDRQREMAQRQAINVVLYALTLNYKRDQIHIPFILKRRQR